MKKPELLMLDSCFLKKIWGGRKLEKFIAKPLPAGKIGEYWAVSTHAKGPSRIKNGSEAGKLLSDHIAEYPEKILGSYVINSGYAEFPLLIKYIDASDRLSVQVHPDDLYAQEQEQGLGKTEMWYILQAEPNIELLYGLKPDTNRQILEQAVEEEKIQDYLRFVQIKTGDVLFVPHGTVHTILGGVVLLEIEENSEANYRLYDWDRIGLDGKARELHLDKALAVINYSFKGEISHPLEERRPFGHFALLSECSHFRVELYKLKRSFNLPNMLDRFQILLFLSGAGKINYPAGTIFFQAGDSLLVPANFNAICIEPISKDVKIIRVFIP